MNHNKAYIIDDRGFITEVNSLNDPDGGCEAVFIQISPRVGIKGYEDKNDARTALKKQTKAHEIGIAPKVLSEIIEIIMPVGGTTLGYTPTRYQKNAHRRLFGFKTQVATRVGDVDYDKNRTRINTIEKKLKRLRLDTGDMHYNNLGWIGNKLVYIDFGLEST